MVEAVVQYDYDAREPDELTIRKGDVLSDIRMQDGGWWEGSLNGKRGMFPDNFVKITENAESNGPKNEVNLRTTSGRRCKVLYSYQPNNEDELQLQVNDIIDVLAEVEDGWWKGCLRNKVGVFPSNFVKEIVEKTAPEPKSTGSRQTSQTQPPVLTQLLKHEEKPAADADMATDSPASPTGPNSGNPAADIIDAPTLPPKPGAMKEQCRALFPYTAHNEDELTLEEGDIITILSKEVQDEGWWKGALRGKVGVFPDNFVEELPPVPIEEPQQRKPERPPAKVGPGIPTNKSIAKPTSKPANASIGSTGSLTKKSAESSSKSSSKGEDKVPTASVLPVLNKKPLFPPTAKKPQLRPVSGISMNSATAEQRHGDFIDGAASSRVAPPQENGKTNDDDMDFDGVERSAMLTHPTARRARAPGRRPPSSIFNKDSEPWSGLVNGNSDHDNHEAQGDHLNDSNEVKETTNATSARSKEWEKHKAPWMEELKQNQAKKIQNTRTSPIPSPTTKPETGRKSDGCDNWSNPTTPEAGKTTSNVPRPHSVPNNGTVTPKAHVEAPGRSPRTSINSFSPGSADTSSNAISVSTCDEKMNMPVFSKQFHDVLDRVSKLESLCEVLNHQVAQLTVQLNEEYEKRRYFQQELEKIADLVTQV